MSDALHADQIHITSELAARLVSEQMPQLAHLPLRQLNTGGSDNVMFRLGDDLALRLPKRPDASGQIVKEFKFLPGLAHGLPLAIPAPIHLGAPSDLFPFPWSICKWIEDENAYVLPVADLGSAAHALAAFVSALHRLDTTGGPPPGDHNFHRGVPLRTRDRQTRACIADLEGLADCARLLEIWDAGLNLPEWDKAPVWIHGDIHTGNLLVQGGALTAVIDFGGLALGDPACDLMLAWSMLDTDSRVAFRSLVQVDEATWLRGRAWALSVAVVALPYYINSSPFFVAISRHAIDHILMDYANS